LAGTLTGKKRYGSRDVHASGKRDAQEQCNRWVLELKDGLSMVAAGSFGDLCEQWIAVKTRRWPPSTLRENSRIVRRNLKPLHAVDLAKLTTHTLDVFYGELAMRGGACMRRPCQLAPCPEHGPRCRRKTCDRPACSHRGACSTWRPCEDFPCAHGGPLAASTVNRIHAVVHAALEQAVKWQWIRRNPAEHAEPGEIVENEVEPPTDVDVVQLLAEAEQIDPRLAVFLQIAIVTGARRGAICALRWTHLDLRAGTARFPRVISIGPDGSTHPDGTPRQSVAVDRPATRSKRSGRKVALDPYLVAALVAHHDRQVERATAAGAVLAVDTYVFSDDVLGEHPWRPDSTSRKYRHFRWWVSGLSESRLHDLRHFMATQLLGAGVDPKVVAQRGGWSKVATMLDRYAHALPANDRAAADVLGEMLSGER
jgi:integrase